MNARCPVFRLALLFAIVPLFLTLAPIGLAQSPSLSTQDNAQGTQLNTRRFSIRYPSHWIVSNVDESTFILYNQQPPRLGGGEAPPYMIKTTAGFASGSFEELIAQQSRTSRRGMPERVIKQQQFRVNGKPALRVWTEIGDNFTHSIITYVRYDSRETAYIVSYYNDVNTDAEPIILQVHNLLDFRYY